MNDKSNLIERPPQNSEEDKRELEWHCFLRLSWIDFDGVRDSLVGLRKVGERDMRYRLLREIAVSYARPFSANWGHLISRPRLGDEMVPDEFLGLHKTLINLRDERFAHTDITHYNPKLARWKTKDGWGYPMSFKGFDYEALDKQVPEIEKLVKEITEILKTEIAKGEARFNEKIGESTTS